MYILFCVWIFSLAWAGGETICFIHDHVHAKHLKYYAQFYVLHFICFVCWCVCVYLYVCVMDKDTRALFCLEYKCGTLLSFCHICIDRERLGYLHVKRQQQQEKKRYVYITMNVYSGANGSGLHLRSIKTSRTTFFSFLFPFYLDVGIILTVSCMHSMFFSQGTGQNRQRFPRKIDFLTQIEANMYLKW